MAKRRMTKKQQKEMAKFAIANWKLLVVLLLIVVVFGVTAYFMGWLDPFLANKNNTTSVPERMSTAGGYTTTLDAPKDLVINFFSVGQADCMIIELPDGKYMIIDGGDDKTTDRTTISEYTTAKNITTFDYMLLTHPHQDHIANLSWVLENYVVRYVFRPNVYSDNTISSGLPDTFNVGPREKDTYCTTNVYAEFLVSLYNEENCSNEIFDKNSDFSNKVLCGETEYIYSFDFLTPTITGTEVSSKNMNNYSPIVMLEYAGRKIIFTGDAETNVLIEYVNAYGNANNVDVLKVGHHGSRNATTQAFIDAIDPEYAIIQVYPTRKDRLPNTETLNILDASGAAIYRNDTNGNIVLTINKLGNMSWVLEDTDMSNNMKNGEEMCDLYGIGNTNSIPNFDIIYEDKKIRIA